MILSLGKIVYFLRVGFVDIVVILGSLVTVMIWIDGVLKDVMSGI